MILEIKYKKKKPAKKMCMLNNMLLNNQRFSEEVREEITKKTLDK